jgi:hypothetical protein
LKVVMIKWRVPNAVANKSVTRAADLTPQIATRAYELYEQGGRQDGRAIQDWEKAEREVRKADAKAQPKPNSKAEPKPAAKAEPKPGAIAKPTADAKVEPAPDAGATIAPDVTPQLVTRVHELYEELGREDVRAVGEWEKAQREKRNDTPKK